MKSRAFELLRRLRSLFLILILLPTATFAQVEQANAPLTDHSLIEGYPYSEIIERSLERDINYRFVLGSLERVRGEVIPEDSERLRGDVTRITYEVSQEFTGEDVYQFFTEQLDSRNYALLFTCQGRGCGSSNYWANDIFRNRILYGPESNQYYLAFRANPTLEDGPYFSLYIITRVNRSIYAYLEIIEPGGTQEVATAPTNAAVAVPSNLLQRLNQQGSVRLPTIAFRQDDSLPAMLDLEPIVSALNADRELRVYLVAHLSEQGQPLDALLRRSEARASALRQALLAAGVEADRIEAAGVGPLAPSCSTGDCAERVELVLRR